MTIYVVWEDPFSSEIPIPITSKMSVKNVVRLQFTRYPKCVSTKQAIQDFVVTNWGWISAAENEGDKIYLEELLT